MKPPRFRFKTILMRCAIGLLVVGVTAASYIGYRTYAAAAKVASTSNPIKLVASFTRTDLDSTNGITNVLVAGNSSDDTGHSGAALTDSIMVVSINQTTKKATIISIPRDLWVNIPGYGYAKINAAYPYGGMPLLEQVIETNLGIHCNYSMLVNYTALKDAVDAVGGIDVTIASSDTRGLYDPSVDYSTGSALVNLTNGVHHLSGQQALNLARARGDSYGSYGYAQSDFTRTQYQQQILLALYKKATTAGVIANPIAAGKIISSLGSNVTTDLSIGQMETLYNDYKKTSVTTTQVTLNNVNGQNLLMGYTSSNGQSALIPAAGIDNFVDIQTTLQSIINPTSATSTST